MSVIEVVEHNEVIYRIFEKPPPEPPKSPRYESKFKSTGKRDIRQKSCQLRRTMGYAQTPLLPPDNFLKKGEGIQPPIKPPDHKCKETRMVPVPKCPGPAKKVEKPIVNFRVQNIIKAVKAKPKEPDHRMVDTRYGHVNSYTGYPKCALGKYFGRMPDYLLKRNAKEGRKTKKIIETFQKREDACKLISSQERDQLLQDLKDKWAARQKDFLQLPMITDTTPKIVKKTKMEVLLTQLEKDIQLIEANPYIYVYE